MFSSFIPFTEFAFHLSESSANDSTPGSPENFSTPDSSDSPEDPEDVDHEDEEDDVERNVPEKDPEDDAEDDEDGRDPEDGQDPAAEEVDGHVLFIEDGALDADGSDSEGETTFADLDLPEDLLKAVTDMGRKNWNED